MIRQVKLKTIECPTCEQPFACDLEVCPHCGSEYQIGLEITENEFKESAEQLRNKHKQNPDDPKIHEELVRLLYSQAMRTKYDDPAGSLKLFEEVVSLQPNHWESRLKVSWLSIKFNKNQNAIDALVPVVKSTSATLLQKQRAYTNLSCAENWKPVQVANYPQAETYARDGIALDGEGTAKLWENLATSLKHQNRMEDARAAFKRALKLNPKSSNAIERQASIDRHLKTQKKQSPSKRFKLRSPRDLLGKKGGGDFVKL